MNENELILSNDAGAAIDDDGWALIAPFGEHPKTRIANLNGVATRQKFIQILDNESADHLLSKENSFFRKLRRAIVGIPVYLGHPDLRDFSPESLANTAAQKKQIGVIDKVRKCAQGIQAHFVLSNDGAFAVENGEKYPSALWLVLPNGTRDGATLARPFKLLSVGLTAHPNITGVESLANARGADAQPNTEPDMKLIAGWLLAQGVALANTEAPTESQVLEAFQKLHTAKAGEVVALGNEKTTSAGKMTALENERNALAAEKSTLSTRVTALENEAAALKTETAALKKGRATLAIDLAIQKGKLKPADRAAKIETLANSADFDKDAAALMVVANIVKIPGDTASGKVLSNDDAGCDPRAAYSEALASHMKETGETDPVKANASLKKKRPNLYEALGTRDAAGK